MGKTPERKYQRPTVSFPSSPDEHQYRTTARQTTNRDNPRGILRGTSREAPRRTEIPVQQPQQNASATGYQPNTERKVQVQTDSTYQNPGPGFNQTVANVPGVGLVYNNNSSQPFNGYNPTSGQQSQQHQTPGFTHPQQPQVLPPGFSQVPQVPAQPVGHNPNMSYNITSMPNQGQQHFQPPVPDTTYGPIPHTYHPRFDADTGGAQYVIIGGALYQVMQAQGATGAGAQVYYVPAQQVSVVFTLSAIYEVTPLYIAHEAMSQQPVYYMVNASIIRILAKWLFG